MSIPRMLSLDWSGSTRFGSTTILGSGLAIERSFRWISLLRTVVINLALITLSHYSIDFFPWVLRPVPDGQHRIGKIGGTGAPGGGFWISDSTDSPAGACACSLHWVKSQKRSENLVLVHARKGTVLMGRGSRCLRVLGDRKITCKWRDYCEKTNHGGDSSVRSAP